ncbi:hypothetical protein [Bacillus taeanensis]|uniref:hypothetical protein n=1 Tax=Bacillus taeanensis TaxID=273032 RepID=UPI0015F11BD1|nr:hypothetical protein [Bacillus taeanensis]
MINKLKSGRVSNPIAYYYRILENKLEQQYFEQLYIAGFQAEQDENFHFFAYDWTG